MSEQGLRQIGKYTIQKVLGEGAMGKVYKGLDEDLQRVVAIKTIHKHLLMERDRKTFLERFRQEARIAGRCMHPNVVTLFEFGVHQDMPFIAMEYVKGKELLAYMREGVPFDLGNTIRVIRQLLSALKHAHGHNVVHRDIKPANVFLMKNGRIKLGDFGIAKVDTSQLTQQGMMIGSPGYMAPEQFTDGTVVDWRADLFAVGVVLFELLTGTKPFPGKTAIDTMRRILDVPPQNPSKINPRLPESLDAIVQRALSKDPKDRFPSAKAFSDTLKEVLLVKDGKSGTQKQRVQTQATPLMVPSNPPLEATSSGFEQAHTIQGWNPKVLEQAEKDLVEHIGPLAKVLVARAARDSSTIHDLYSTLAQSVNQPSSQIELRSQGDNLSRTFTGQRPEELAEHQTLINSSFPKENSAKKSSALEQAITPERLQKIEQMLTEFVGPIAKVLVKKKAQQASSVIDLCKQLLEFIPSQEQQDVFMKQKYN